MVDHPGTELSGYVDGELDLAAAAAVESHLALCADCRALVEDLRRLKTEAIEVPIDEVTTQRFLVENRKRRGEPSGFIPSRRPAWLVPSLMAAAACLVAVSLFVGLQHSPRGAFSPLAAPSSAPGSREAGSAPAAESLLDHYLAPAPEAATMGQNQASLSAGIY